MTVLRNIVTHLDADSSKFLRGVDQATNSVQRLERDVSRSMRVLTRSMQAFGVVAAANLGAGAFRGIENFAQRADDLGKFANRIDASVERLSQLQYAAELSGVSLEQFNKGILTQTVRVAKAAEGNKLYSDSLEAIGINIKDIQDLAPGEQFLAIARALESVENQSERVRVAQELWSKSGTQLLQITNQGTEAIMEMMEASDELGRTLRVQTTRDAAAFNDAISEFTASLSGLANTVLPAILPLLTKMINGISNSLQMLARLGRFVADTWDAAKRKIDEVFGTSFADQQLSQTESRVKSLTTATENYAGALNTVQRSQKRANDQLVAFTDDSDGLIIDIQGLDAATLDYIETLKRQERQFEVNEQKIEQLVNWFHQLDPAEQARQWSFYIEELERFGQTVDADLTKPIQDWVILAQRQLERLDDTFRNFWEDILRGNESVFESFKNLAISVLAEIIHEYTTKKIVAEIQTILTEAGGGPGGQGGGGEDRGGILGTIGKIASSLLGLGITAAVGSVLSNLIGGGDRIKESQIFAGNLFDGLQGPLTTNIESIFGPDISFALRRIGNRGQLGDEEAERILRSLDQAGKVIQGIDDLIASTLTDTQITDIGEILADLEFGSRNFSPEVIDKFLRQRYEAIFGAIDESLGGIFEEFAPDFEGDALLKFASDIARINAAIADGRLVFTDLTTTAETVNALMTDFVRQGESLADVLERISSANGILGLLGLDTETSGGALFNLRVLEALGDDVGRLDNLVTGFFETFFTELENLTRAEERLKDFLPDLLEDLGTTRDTFADDFLRNLTEGLLSPEDVVRWLEAAEALGALLDIERRLADLRENEAREAALERIDLLNEEIDALRDTSEALDEQISAQQRLQDEIGRISDALNERFASTVERIRFNMLDEPGQIRFLELTLEDLRNRLSLAETPEDIQKLLNRINDTTESLIRLLGPETTEEVIESLLDDLAKSFIEGQEKLTELEDEAYKREQELIEQQRRVQEEIAAKMEEAANIQREAAGDFSDSVGRFQSLLNTPIDVRVTLEGGGELVG